MKRVLAVTALDLGLECGPTLHFMAVAREIRRHGIDLRVLAARIPEESHDWVSCAKPAIPVKAAGSAVRASLNLSVRNALATARFDAVYVRGGLPGVVEGASRAGVPSFVEINGSLADELKSSGVGLASRVLQLRRERIALRDCTGVVVVNRETLGKLVGKYPWVEGKARVIANGCETLPFAHAAKPACERAHGSCVFLGGIHAWTRLEIPLEALRHVPQCSLDVIGDGPRLAALRALANQIGVQDRVVFHGRLPHHAVPAIVGRCQFGLGNFEPDGVDAGGALKVSEYLAGGVCPIVRSNQSLRFLDKLGLGVLLEGDVTIQSLASSMLHAMGRDELVAESAIGARIKYAGEYLDWSATARNVIEFMESRIACRSHSVRCGAS